MMFLFYTNSKLDITFVNFTCDLSFIGRVCCSFYIFFKAVGCGCITSEEKCLLSVSAIVPFLFRAPTVTSATAGTLPQSARSLQVCVALIERQVFLHNQTVCSLIVY